MYHRRELWLLFLLVLALAVGSLVQQLRHGFPELARHLESLDQEEELPSNSTTSRQDGQSPGSSPFRSQKLSPSDQALQSPVDLNRADIADLQRLPGIGPITAKRIIEAREQRGRFEAIDDLLTVPGIGAKKFEAIKALVTVEPPSGG